MIRLLAGDCRDVLPTLAADSVHCVVTSPPYYGLRDYGTALWDGGDAACGHLLPPNGVRDKGRDRAASGGTFHDSPIANQLPMQYRDTCGKCGAVRIDRQIGLESSPDAYLATMVAVFREVRRVLRPDGTCWVNMGDSYASGEIGRHDGGRTYRDTYERKSFGTREQRKPSGLKPKDLLLMPARLALALQADGWWVRQAITWCKSNPMPESATDRCTSATEMVYMLTKRPKYFYDAIAIAEPAIHEGRVVEYDGSQKNSLAALDPKMRTRIAQTTAVGATRNARNWWVINTHAFPSAHFATFPPELAERCIRAGTSERGACSQCGKPWGRVTQETDEYAAVKAALKATKAWNRAGLEAVKGPGTGTNPATLPIASITTGWQPGCKCHQIPAPGNGTSVSQGHSEPRNAREQGDDAAAVCSLVPASGKPLTVPCTVLDPFAGAGTTLLIADRLQRDAIGIELNVAYTEMAMERCRADAPLFTSFPPAEPPEDERMADLFADAAE